MTDKEFKQLKRSELIDIIFQYQMQEKELREEIRQLKIQMKSQNAKTIEDAKTIAEVVKNLGIIVETTQKMADDYLESVHYKGDKLLQGYLKQVKKLKKELDEK